MNQYLLARLIALSLAAGPIGAAITSGPTQHPGQGLAPAERAALVAAEDASLGTLRGGLTLASPALAGDERAELTRAQLAAAHLAGLRAGAFSDRELGIILIVIGLVIVIALVA